MQLSYLAQGEKTKETISGKNLPEGIALDSVEKYDAKGGQLYFITFSTKSDTLSSARALSRLRDSLPAKNTCEFYEMTPLLNLQRPYIPSWQTMSVLFGECSLSRCVPNMTISKTNW